MTVRRDVYAGSAFAVSPSRLMELGEDVVVADHAYFFSSLVLFSVFAFLI
ncbi:hypothetical protein SESBI_38419 [Sesbania bispinosa]|nr:hypothetical protein SESBI_38419 [Sesbania bispinosa]